MFQGNPVASPLSQHYFFVPPLQKYGLQYLTREAYKMMRTGHFADAYEELLEDSNVAIYYSPHTNIFDYLSAKFGANQFVYYSANANGGYSLRYLSNFAAYVNYVEDTSYEARKTDSRESVIKEVINSLHGFAYANDSPTSGVRLYFQRPYANQQHRAPAIKGTTMFSAPPRMHSGRVYAHKHTKDLQGSLYSDGTPKIGEFKTAEGLSADSPSVSVTAPLKLHYNQNLKCFESSQTFLATLLTDVDPADIVTVNLTVDSTVGRTAQEFFSADAPEKMWDFKTGLAAPLTMHNNNPKAFGPHLINCGDSNKVDQIRVVNRSTTTFSQGETVIVHQIDGENIITKYSTGVSEQRPPKPGRWLFSKFMSNSDEYFRYSATDANFENRPLLLPNSCMDMLRRKFYSAQQDTTNFNSNAPAVGNLFESWQGSIWDQILVSDSGNLNADFPAFYRINIYQDPAGGVNVGSDNVFLSDVQLFWGPMFPDGMRQKLPQYGFTDEFQMPAEVAMPFDVNHHTTIRNINAGNWFNNFFNPGIIGSGWIEPNNQLRVQFSLLSCELFGSFDKGSLLIQDRVGGSTTTVRKFPQRIADLTGNAINTNYLKSTFTKRPTNIIGIGRSCYLFSEGTNIGSFPGIPYDCYIQYKPLNTPKGAPTVFGGDTSPEDDTPYRGSNAVGFISSRLRMNQGSGGAWDLNIEADQTFGSKGRFFGGGGGGSINVTIIGAFLAFSTDNRGRRIEGSVPMWGSNKFDSIDSFGTAAMHVQVWDAWPDEDTVWIPQYFTALHFNPTATTTFTVNKVTNYANAVKNPGSDEWATPPDEDYSLSIQNLDTSVDYRIPTLGSLKSITNADGSVNRFPQYGAGQDGQPLAVGRVSPDVYLRPQNYWNVNTSRRRQLVTQYGYVWKKLVIGVNDFPTDKQIVEPGSGFSVNDRINLSNGIKIKVTSVSDGGISGFEIAETTEDEKFVDINGTKHSYKFYGSGLLPSDFENGKTFDVRSPNGSPALIKFFAGYAWEAWQKDFGPKQRSNMVRVTDNSGEGQERVWGTKSTSIPIEGNPESPYKGQYEIFFHCHNDIGFAWHEVPETTIGLAMAQYITLSIG